MNEEQRRRRTVRNCILFYLLRLLLCVLSVCLWLLSFFFLLLLLLAFCVFTFTCVFAFRYTFFSALFFVVVVVVLNFVYSRLFLQFVFCFSHSLQNLTEFALLSSLSSSSFAYQNFSLDSIFDMSLIIYSSSFAFILSQHFLFICIASLTHQKKTNKNLTSASCDGAGRGGGGTDRVLSPDLCRSVDPSI